MLTETRRNYYLYIYNWELFFVSFKIGKTNWTYSIYVYVSFKVKKSQTLFNFLNLYLNNIKVLVVCPKHLMS
jgi:hypothetical protein